MTNPSVKSNTEKDFKQLSRGASVDMSAAAIKRRIEIVDELRELTSELAQAKKLGRSNVIQPPQICGTSNRSQ